MGCGSSAPKESETIVSFKDEMNESVEHLFSDMSLSNVRKTQPVMDTGEKMIFLQVAKRVSAASLASVQTSLQSFAPDAEEIHGAIARELKRNNYVTGGAPSAPPENDSRDSRIVKKQMDLDMAELRQLATVVQTQQLTEEVVRATKDFWKSKKGKSDLLKLEDFEEIVNKIMLTHTAKLFATIRESFSNEYRMRAVSFAESYSENPSSINAQEIIPPASPESGEEGNPNFQMVDAV